MKKIKWIILIMVLLVIQFQIATAQDLLTLERTLDIAYQGSPEMISQKITLENQRENVNATKAGLKSRFSLSVDPLTYSKNRSFENYANDYVSSERLGSSGRFMISQPITATDGTITLSNQFGFASNSVGDQDAVNSFNNNLQLSINQPLFKKYNTNKMGLLKAELDLENAQLRYSIIKLALEYNVSQYFYNVYSAEQNLITANEELSNQKKSYEIIKNKVSAGLSAEEEFWQAELNLQNAESSVNDGEVSLENAKDRMKQAIGLALNSDFTILANIEVKTIDVKLEDAIEYGLQKRMELRQNEITLENSRMNLLSVQDQDKINGSVQLSVGLQGINEQIPNLYDNPSDNESIALSFNIPIWDWGARKSRIKIAENNLKSSEINQEQEKINIEMEIRQTYRSLKNLVFQIAIAQKSVENAQKTYALNLEKYENGDLTSMDLKQFSDQLTQKRNSLTTARINYKLGLLQLKNQTLWDFETNQSVFSKNNY
ncbi:MAG: TolC family protein [Prolixibacteraceae bacterium]